MRLKTAATSLLLFLFSLACIPPLFSQTASPPVTPPELTEVFAAGGSWNQNGNPQFAFTVFNAHRVSTGLFTFSVVDVFALTNPTPLAPGQSKYSITTTPTTGVAQHLRDFGKVKIYVIATVGAAAGGSRVGWAYTTGGCAYIGLGKGLSIIPNFRTVKTSLSGDFQGIYGVAFGWGK
jgi:hypothetical protein